MNSQADVEGHKKELVKLKIKQKKQFKERILDQEGKKNNGMSQSVGQYSKLYFFFLSCVW